MTTKDRTYRLIELMFVILVSTIVGMISGGAAIFTMLDVKQPTKFSETTFSGELSEVNSVYQDIMDKYYKDIDKKELIKGAINGMMSVLEDPNSTYYDQQEASSFNDRLEGKYVGLGLEILKDGDGKILVVGIFANTPASKSNLKEGDYILEVDGKPLLNKTAEEAASLIKRAAGKEATLTVERDGKTFTEKVASGYITIQSVESNIFNKGKEKIGYIKLTIFASNTSEQFDKAFKDLEKQNITSLVLDVRDNSGGYLTAVTDILEKFLEKRTVLYQTKDTETINERLDTTDEKRNMKVVVLINENSASASEILAVSLSEKYGAKLVGKKSFGKGTVQQVMNTSSGGIAKITIQEWLSPNGKHIDKVGVLPDHEVELDYNKYDKKKPETDAQLQKALEVIVK